MSARSSALVPHHSFVRSHSYAQVLSGQAQAPMPHPAQPAHSLYLPPSYLPRMNPTSSNGSLTTVEAANRIPTTVPSYLQESLYAERLANVSHSVFNNPPVSPLTPTSNGAKKIHRHRGVATDIIEHPPKRPDELSALPSRWNEHDKHGGIELLNNGCEVTVTGGAPVQKTDNEAAGVVRADKHMPPQCGLFYYEITVVSKGKDGQVGIGFCSPKAKMNLVPGWGEDSWAYHGDDGETYCGGRKDKYGPTFSSGDIIGCGVNFRDKTAFFTKNGRDLGVAFRSIDTSKKLYPVVGARKQGEHLRVNFGQEAFVFDIDNYMENEKAKTKKEINSQSASTLCPPLEENALIHALITQYLSHECFVATARAFADDIKNEYTSLELPFNPSTSDPKADLDAQNRQRIRSALLNGNVDHVLKLTETFYPNVLAENSDLRFRLRRRKLLEMIRATADRDQSGNPANGYHMPSPPQEMDLDITMGDGEVVGTTDEWDGMDMDPMDEHTPSESVPTPLPESGTEQTAETGDGASSSSSGKPIREVDPLDAVVKYARQLRVDFDADNRPEIKKSLDEVIPLIAYLDPKSSEIGHLLDEEERVVDAEALNSAILKSQGKSPVAALQRLVQQSAVLVQEMSEHGGPGAFVNVKNDYLKPDQVIMG